MNKRQLFKGDHVVRTDNDFGKREGSTGKIVYADESNIYRVHWDGEEKPDTRNYYPSELGLIFEEHNDW